jgi:hypothetical protein
VANYPAHSGLLQFSSNLCSKLRLEAKEPPDTPVPHQRSSNRGDPCQLHIELNAFSELEERELARHFVGIGTDGAAVLVLQGCHKDLQTRFQKKLTLIMCFHCTGHGVDLAAQALSQCTIADEVIKACTKSTAEYFHGGNRLLRIEQCRDQPGVNKVTLKTVASTRWMSHRNVIDRAYVLLPAFFFYT